jgi:hypothetical protein
LAEQVDRLSKKKQRRVLGRGSERSFGSGANLLTGDAKPLGHKSSIVQIKIRPRRSLAITKSTGARSCMRKFE